MLVFIKTQQVKNQVNNKDIPAYTQVFEKGQGPKDHDLLVSRFYSSSMWRNYCNYSQPSRAVVCALPNPKMLPAEVIIKTPILRAPFWYPDWFQASPVNITYSKDSCKRVSTPLEKMDYHTNIYIAILSQCHVQSIITVSMLSDFSGNSIQYMLCAILTPSYPPRVINTWWKPSFHPCEQRFVSSFVVHIFWSSFSTSTSSHIWWHGPCWKQRNN